MSRRCLLVMCCLRDRLAHRSARRIDRTTAQLDQE
jgi:hypothetical protein